MQVSCKYGLLISFRKKQCLWQRVFTISTEKIPFQDFIILPHPRNVKYKQTKIA